MSFFELVRGWLAVVVLSVAFAEQSVYAFDIAPPHAVSKGVK